MDHATRIVLALWLGAASFAAAPPVPLDCTLGLAAAPAACGADGSGCCCVDTGACLCPRPVEPTAPAGDADEAIASPTVESRLDLARSLPIAVPALAPRTDGCAQRHPATVAVTLHERLCVLQV